MNHSTKTTKKKIKHLDAHKESYALAGRKRYIRRVLYVFKLFIHPLFGYFNYVNSWIDDRDR